MKYLLKQGADLEVKDDEGDTPLYMATGYAYLELVKYLIEQGADIVAENEAGKTPLQIAILSKNQELVECFGLKGEVRKRGSIKPKSNVVFPPIENDLVTSGGGQPSAWISNFSGIFKKVPQLIFSSSDVALAEQAALTNSMHMGLRDDVKIGNISVDSALLLCDLVLRKITGRRPPIFFQARVPEHVAMENHILDAIHRFESSLESKTFNNTFK